MKLFYYHKERNSCISMNDVENEYVEEIVLGIVQVHAG